MLTVDHACACVQASIVTSLVSSVFQSHWQVYLHFVVFVKFGDHTEETGVPEDAHFLPMPLTSTTFWRVLMAFSRTGSTDCMIPSLLSMSLIYGCMPSMAFIFLATSTRGCPSSSLLRILAVRAFWMFLIPGVLATAASAS